MNLSKKKVSFRTILLFLSPLALLFLVFRAYPFFMDFFLSLKGASGVLTIGNYVNVLFSSDFWHYSTVTITYAIISVSVEMLVGFGFALVLNRRFLGRRIMRTIFLLPWVIPTAIVAVGWKFLFQHSFGPIPWMISWIGLTKEPLYFLITPSMAFLTVVILDIWKTTPFCALLLLAGLQQIPNSLYEAASIDGANSFQQLVRITLPLMIPSFVITFLFRFLQAFAVFASIHVLTGGGPGGATQTLSVGIYKQVFRYFNIGTGMAMAIITILYISAFLLLIMLTRKVLENRFGRQA